MGEILLKKFASGSFTTIAYTYHIKTRDQFTSDMMSPVIVDDMPLESKENTLLTKIQGNTMNIMLVWTLVDSPTSVVDEATIKTADEQHSFLQNTYEPIGFDNSLYEIELVGVTPQFKKMGTISAIKVEQTTASATTYKATVMFTVGKGIIAL